MPAPTPLPEQIRNLQPEPPVNAAYATGWVEARHAAAELAAAALSAAPPAQVGEPAAEGNDLDPQMALAYARRMKAYCEAFDGRDWAAVMAYGSPDEQNLAHALDNLIECAAMLMNMASRVASPLPQEPQEVKALTPERVAEIAEGYPEKWAATPGFLPWFARAIERELRGAQEGKAVEWRTVERDGLPPCDGETVFVGINSAGFACCFNEARPDGLCLMGSPECSTVQMSELRWWRVLDRPSSREGEQR